MITAEELKTHSKEQVLAFIRKQLAFKGIAGQIRHVDREEFKKEHRRFDMSGYEAETGECTVTNMAILNEFAYLGIYDYTQYLFLDFYKGIPMLYLKYWSSDENLEFDYCGWRTTEIIYAIFELTIFSGKPQRRRQW